MTDEEKNGIRLRQAEGMRALSDEEMAQRQLEMIGRMKNASHYLTGQQLAQWSSNFWAQSQGLVELEPIHIPPRKNHCYDKTNSK